MLSCQKGPTRHAYAGFWQDTLAILLMDVWITQLWCDYTEIAISQNSPNLFISTNKWIGNPIRWSIEIDTFL